MRNYLLSTVVLTTLAMPACGTSSTPMIDSQPPVGTNTAIQTQPQSTASGLGTIAYNGTMRAECSRRVRTGSRIHKPVCESNNANGAGLDELNEGLVRAPVNQRRVAK